MRRLKTQRELGIRASHFRQSSIAACFISRSDLALLEFGCNWSEPLETWSAAAPRIGRSHTMAARSAGQHDWAFPGRFYRRCGSAILLLKKNQDPWLHAVEAAGSQSLDVPHHFPLLSRCNVLMIQFAAGRIGRGGRVNDSPNQTATVVRMELRGSAT